MAAHLRACDPFSFWRFGDGALECMAGKRGKTCDGEQYSADLSSVLNRVRLDMQRWTRPNTYLGDWLTATFRNHLPTHAEEWSGFLGTWRPSMLAWESLLLMRATPAIQDFYVAARADGRRKLYMGAPWACTVAQERLGMRVLVLPTRDLWDCTAAISGQLDASDFDVLYFGGGMAGMCCAARHWLKHPERSYVHLGSALDPCSRRTRSQQLTQGAALAVLPAAKGEIENAGYQPGRILRPA